MHSYSLFEVNEFIKRVLALNFPEALWVRSEIAQIKAARGHFFLDLVEKGENGDDILAQAQAVFWNKDFKIVSKKSGAALDAILKEGMEILFLAKVVFNERYGLKLLIEDLDPVYTMGRLELKKREIIRQLKMSDLLDRNKTQPLPPVLQRIAVLSSETAAGLQDFLEHLKANPFGYRFDAQLFSTSMQGIYVEKEMMAQLDVIEKKAASFDCVVIIRGGGAKLDLAAFDSFELCKKVAHSTLPVFTGIGHDVDETILDLVAHHTLKTPTAVADFLVQHNLAFETLITNLGMSIKTQIQYLLNKASLHLQHLLQTVRFQSKNQLNRQQLMIAYIKKELPQLLRSLLKNEKNRLDALEVTSKLLSPESAFRRGFSLTFLNGKVLKQVSELKTGDEVVTRLHKGAFTSIVKNPTDE